MDNTFEDIASPLLENRKFQQIAYESHHGITRMEHSMRVAKYTYKISKKINIDYVSATRAAILHDFFLNKDIENVKGIKRGIVHPSISLENANKVFKLNDIEKNAILSHMFPLKLTLPRYKESWVITGVDKIVAIYEYFSYKFSYRRVVNRLSVWSIFIFNILTMK